jgi:hypothetical protein
MSYFFFPEITFGHFFQVPDPQDLKTLTHMLCLSDLVFALFSLWGLLPFPATSALVSLLEVPTKNIQVWTLRTSQSRHLVNPLQT